jgi:hypothetical protein
MTIPQIRSELPVPPEKKAEGLKPKVDPTPKTLVQTTTISIPPRSSIRFDLLILHTAALRPCHKYRHFYRLPPVAS